MLFFFQGLGNMEKGIWGKLIRIAVVGDLSRFEEYPFGVFGPVGGNQGAGGYSLPPA